MPCSDFESDEYFGSHGGFCLASWTCKDEESRSIVTLSWQTLRPIVYTLRDEVNSMRLNIQVYLFLFYGREHHQGEFSRRIDEHIREGVQRYTVGQREKTKKRWSIRAANMHLIDRTERTEKIKTRTHTFFHRSIDRHTRWSEKPSLLRNRSILARLTWISFYISSRRVRICVNEDRSATISFSQLDYDDTFGLRAMMNRIFAWNSLTDGIQQQNWSDCDGWWAIAHAESNAVFQLKFRRSLLKLWRIYTPEYLFLEENLHEWGFEGCSLFSKAYLSTSHQDE